jgi:hypothetical protein
VFEVLFPVIPLPVSCCFAMPFVCIGRRSNCRLLYFDSSSASHARPGSGVFTMPVALAVVAIVGYYTLIVVPRHMLVRALVFLQCQVH